MVSAQTHRCERFASVSAGKRSRQHALAVLALLTTKVAARAQVAAWQARSALAGMCDMGVALSQLAVTCIADPLIQVGNDCGSSMSHGYTCTRIATQAIPVA